MRKHSARKWLHFFLDLLPIILIPVFMIYSHRHTLTESVDVDIAYKYQTNEVNTWDDVIAGNMYHFDYLVLFDDYTGYGIDVYSCEQLIYEGTSTNNGYRVDNYNANEDNFIYIYAGSSNYRVSFTNYNAYAEYIFTWDEYITLTNCDITISAGRDKFVQVMSIYGDYYLPSASDFNVIESVDIQDTNSDIMSVFMNDFNNAVNNYFNMQQVFNFSDIYNWLNVNMFGGTAPAVILSVYNIIVYEFLMDLIFLMYSIFMFIIDFSQELLSRCFSFSRHGGSR